MVLPDNVRTWREAGGQPLIRAAAICGWELPRHQGVVFKPAKSWEPGREWSDREVTSMSKPLIKQQDQRQAPWNKGRLVGQKRALRPKEVWNIRARLQIDARRRDLAMFNLAIDSKLRGATSSV